MLSIKQITDPSLLNKNIDPHKNILFIGSGITDYKLNQIAYFSSSSSIENAYGSCELSEAYSVAKKFGVKDVFIANIKSRLDYISIVDVISHHDFSYIVPLGFSFSDEFYDPIDMRMRTFTEYYVTTLGRTCNSTIIVTDEHASLYEDIDSFIDDMESKINLFKSKYHDAVMYGNNLIFIGNNLKDYNKASLALGCALCATKIGEYPLYEFGEAIFDIDPTDIWQSEFAYFKNNLNCPTSIENLNNFREEMDADKIVTIDMIIKYVERQLDFSYFKGKFFTEYIRLEIYKLLSKFFSENSDKFTSYKIRSVLFVPDKLTGTGSIVNNITICPINSVEEFDVMVEV
jgi:hypothetical protein